MNTTRQITPDQGRILVLVATLLVAGLGEGIFVAIDYGNWSPVAGLVYFGAMAVFPFLLARLAPTAAGFDTQWLPSSRRHWIWFFGLVGLLFASNVVVAALAVIIGSPPPEPPATLSAPIAHIFQGIELVLVAPVAEEIFFRGYLLEQLRKLMRSSMALLIQSVLFALGHILGWGFDAFSLLHSFGALLFGLVAGLWRIQFRSLLPIVLGHIFCNAIGIPLLVEEYERAVSQVAASGVAGTAESDAPMESVGRAQALFDAGEYSLALRELRNAVEVEPTDFLAHYLLGWIYATSPDEGCRDKEKALFHADKAVTLWLSDASDDNRALWMMWACLAAAYAESGDFDKAIENQQKAIECLSFVPEEVRPLVEPRVKVCLELYKARKPLRSKKVSLGKLSDAWLNAMSHPGPEGFPEIAE